MVTPVIVALKTPTSSNENIFMISSFVVYINRTTYMHLILGNVKKKVKEKNSFFISITGGLLIRRATVTPAFLKNRSN